MWRKIQLILLAFVYWVVHGPAVYAQETSFWAHRRRAAFYRTPASSALSVLTTKPLKSAGFETDQNLIFSSSLGEIPSPLFQSYKDLFSVLARSPGTVRKVSLPPAVSSDTPLVVHIQDVHGNEQAQRHIASAIEALVSQGRTSAIGLEGTSGPLSLKRFREYENREAVRRAADVLLRDQKISGPVYAALTGAGPWPETMGLENPALYWANVQAYRAAAPLQIKVRARLAPLRGRLESEKKEIYSPALLAFDEAVRAYANRRLSLGDFVCALPPGADTDVLARFRETVALEKTINFSQVQAEQARLISMLEQRLPPRDLAALVRDAEGFRLGQVRRGVFYDRLKCRARQAGLGRDIAVHLTDYFRYVELADAIDADRLSSDLAAAEKIAFKKLAQTSAQINLVDRSRRLLLAEKLADFLLMPSEWDEYAAVPQQKRPVFLAPFENFYKQAQARDRAMAECAAALFKKGANGPRVCVLVTGGFHAEAMADHLTRTGASVVSFVPKLENVEIDSVSVSLGLFAQEKAPLEKLFQKDKLFLAHPPIRSSTLKVYLPALVTAFTYLVGGALSQFDANTLFAAILGGAGTLAAIKLPEAIRLTWSMGSDKLSFDVTSRNKVESPKTGNQKSELPWLRWAFMGFLLLKGINAVFFDPAVLAFGFILISKKAPAKKVDPLDTIRVAWQYLFITVARYVDSEGQEKSRLLTEIMRRMAALMQFSAKLDKRMLPFWTHFESEDQDYMEGDFITEWLVRFTEFILLPRNLGSLADEWAWQQWGRPPKNRLFYEVYSLFGAPAWEWIYQVLPLNLWAQRGGADWIMRRFFGKNDSSSVVRQVPGQGLVTLFGLGAMALGLWGGTVLTIALGGFAYAAASAFVFSHAHKNKTVANRQVLFYLGFVLALSLIGPSLFLFWLDPADLTGLLKMVAYGSTLFMGWTLNFAIHVVHEDKNLISRPLHKSENPSLVPASVFRDRLLSAERALAFGDWERAGAILKEINRAADTSNASDSLGKQWLDILNKRLTKENVSPQINKSELQPFQLFEEMETALFEDRNFMALVQWWVKFEGMELAEGQTRLLKDWGEIIHVLSLFLKGKWQEADKAAQDLETTARLIVRDDGIFQPYREQLLFGFLKEYWSRRATAKAPAVQELLTQLSNSKLTWEDLSRIGQGVRGILMDLNDYEQAALNVHAIVWSALLPFRGPHPLPTFVFLDSSAGLADFKPILYRVVELKMAQTDLPAQPNLLAISDLIEAIVENKPGYSVELNRMGINLLDIWGLGSHVVAPSLKEIFFPGMHEVGGTMGNSDREKLMIQAGNEASLETRKKWAENIDIALEKWERNRLMEKLGLITPLNDLKSLLRMEHPVLHYLGAPIPVRFRLLPGTYDRWGHGPRAGIRFVGGQSETVGKNKFYVEIVLHENDLAAVLHEGVELLLTFKRNARYPKGPAHPYGFLAEIVANDLSADDVVPQRALQQLERYNLSQLDKFTRGTAINAHEIVQHFPSQDLFLVRKHLLQINEILFEFAHAMKQERAKDTLESYTADIVAMEQFLSMGNVREAKKVRARAIRRRYHLGKKGQKFKFQAAVFATLEKQLAVMSRRLTLMDDRQAAHTRNLSVHLEPMTAQLFGFDLVALRESVMGLQRFRHEQDLPEHVNLLNLWWDIWSVLSLVVERGDWEEADRKFAIFERKMTSGWLKNGVGQMYLESLGFGFIQQYRRQRDTLVQGERARVLDDAQNALARNFGRAPLTQAQVTSVGRSLTMATVSDPNMYQREHLRYLVESLKSRISEKTKISWTAVLSGKPRDQMTQTSTSPHTPFLIDMLQTSPNAETNVKDLNHYMRRYFEREIGWDKVDDYLSQNQLNFLAANEWISLIAELRQPTEASRESGNLWRRDPRQAGYGMPAMVAAVFVTMATLLAGAIFLKGWTLLAVAATALLAGVLAGRALGGAHPLNLDVKGEGLVKKFAEVRWDLARQQSSRAEPVDLNAANVMADAGDRPLTILYLDKTLVSSWPNIADLIQKFSVPEDGTGLALVPVDEEAQSYVADLPEAFEGHVFEMGRGLFGRGAAPRVPPLKEVERRLEKAGVSLREFNGCRVVTPAGMILDAEGVRTALFQEALVVLLSGVNALIIKRQDLRFIDRAARAIVSAA